MLAFFGVSASLAAPLSFFQGQLLGDLVHWPVLLFSNSLVLPLLAGAVDGKPFSSAFPLSSVDQSKLFHYIFLITPKPQFFLFFFLF